MSPVLQFLHTSRTTVTSAQTEPYRCPVPNSHHPNCKVLLSKTGITIKSLLQNVLTRSGTLPASHSNSNAVSLLGLKEMGNKLTSHFLLVSRLGMSGAILLLLLGASVECTGTTFFISIDFLGEKKHTETSIDQMEGTCRLAKTTRDILHQKQRAKWLCANQRNLKTLNWTHNQTLRPARRFCYAFLFFF